MTEKIIRGLYKRMIEITRMNEPDVVLVPKKDWDQISRKIQYLESALKDARKSRDNLKEKHKELKKWDNKR